MKELTRLQTAVMAAGALLMVVGVGLMVFGIDKVFATVFYTIGAFCFAGMQMLQGYEGNSFVIKRLRRIMVIGDVCFIMAALLMIESNFRVVFPFVATTMDGYNNWVRIVHNNWVVLLLIGAVIEMYSTHRISYELNKEEKDNK